MTHHSCADDTQLHARVGDAARLLPHVGMDDSRRDHEREVHPGARRWTTMETREVGIDDVATIERE